MKHLYSYIPSSVIDVVSVVIDSVVVSEGNQFKTYQICEITIFAIHRKMHEFSQIVLTKLTTKSIHLLIPQIRAYRPNWITIVFVESDRAIFI